MLKTLIHIFLCSILVLNSMVYSVIQGNYELNKAYIIENFCINKDKPAMNCDGKCFLAERMKAEKEKQDANSTYKFSVDFGVYVPAPASNHGFAKIFISVNTAVCAYLEPFTSLLINEVIKPPKI
ncbi:hypothetical protein J2X69_003804 [Algoriphagus sp. 4150]|uniref:hypothetical protein n=1 Tax=Algoriphagus sp. 4150 TaxID=2817756 RepID=UPI00285CFF93|nr:hypothetical protein [Algoriphagus sp. 4150]MDR7131440.1 hypothetical protein [Algoriphagus sp. 4150]